MKITKKQIIALSEKFGNNNATGLRSNLTTCLKEWFPEAFETVLDPNKYYKVITGGDGALGSNNGIGKIIQRPETQPKNYGGEMWDSRKHTGIYFQLVSERVWGLCAGYKLKEATESEVFEALKNEAVKRGFDAGIFIKRDNFDTFKGNQEIIRLGKDWKYYENTNSLECFGIVVFEKGLWAEIIPTITKHEAEKLLNKKIV